MSLCQQSNLWLYKTSMKHASVDVIRHHPADGTEVWKTPCEHCKVCKAPCITGVPRSAQCQAHCMSCLGTPEVHVRDVDDVCPVAGKDAERVNQKRIGNGIWGCKLEGCCRHSIPVA